MPPKLHQEFHSPSTEKYLSSYPRLPRRIRVLDGFVRNFPRRVFKPFRPKQEEKFVSHLLFFKKPLRRGEFSMTPSPYELGIATADIVDRLIAHREAFPREMYYSRLNRGDACYYLAHEGQVKSYQWVNFRECALVWGFTNTLNFFTLPDDTAYAYDFYTYSDARGKGFGSLLKQYMWADLAGKGFSSVVNGIHHYNFVSLKVHLDAGFELQRLYYLYQLMSWQGVFRGTEAETREVAAWLQSLDLAGSH